MSYPSTSHCSGLQELLFDIDNNRLGLSNATSRHKPARTRGARSIPLRVEDLLGCFRGEQVGRQAIETITRQTSRMMCWCIRLKNEGTTG